MMESALAALASLADPSMLLMLLAGVLAGLVIGLIPGLGGTAAMAILLPLTFGMEPAAALAMLIGALAVVHTSDTVATVLLGAPGSASASVTLLDGYPMARAGKAKRALSLAFLSSMVGGVIGAIGLTIAIPVVRPLVLSFGSPELFMLTVLGISMAAVLSRGNAVKGLVAAALGLLLGMIGTAPTTAEYRFTFGSLQLTDGLSLVAVALGAFGLAEIASRAGRTRAVESPVSLQGGWLEGIREWLTHWTHVIRGSLVGIWAGILPGIGATAGTWLSYGQAVATAKDKEKFGKGDPRGVVAPESANSSIAAGDLIPTLMFGIPGSVPAAMLLGMLLTNGIQAGPSIVTDHLDLMYLIIWSFAIASVVGALLCFVSTKPLAKITKVSFTVLGPGLLAIMLLGAYQGSLQVGDLWIMLVLGALGWLLKGTGFPRAPFLIGFVLAVPLERYYFLTDQVYTPAEWLTRPYVLVFIGILAIPAVLAIVRRFRQRPDTALPQRPSAGAEADGPLADSVWSLTTAVGLLVVFAVAWVLAQSFSAEGGLVPQLVAGVGTVLAVILVFREWRGGSFAPPRPDRDPDWVSPEAPDGIDAAASDTPASSSPNTLASTGGTRVAATQVLAPSDVKESPSSARRWPMLTPMVRASGRTFVWMTAFVILVTFFGYVPALLVFLPAFLLFVARTRPKTATIYTAVMVTVIAVTPIFLPIHLPGGMLVG
ncbi:tripartite tricarboxylate transporter permease [Leucobacter tardus]|uniref:Tripartite tricarboxylate transporter permease n=1 Tax=Leucobacter tardus TaxID=501483 RepID=A0A939TUN3_9MICO|nr:tripartite tricarboxylate transporter permease [Leucobacter tardus]MBO2989910.1 tripartite tricarboxylate transporter permease [Leucobacter tardus]